MLVKHLYVVLMWLRLTTSSNSGKSREQRCQHLRLLQQAQQRAMHVGGLCKRHVLRSIRCHGLLQQPRAGRRQAVRPQVAKVVIHVQRRSQHRGQSRKQQAELAEMRQPQHVQLAVLIQRVQRFQDLRRASAIETVRRLQR